MSWFVSPYAFWLLVVLPVLMVFSIVAWRRRRQALARLGSMPAVQALVQTRRNARRLRGLCYFGGVIVLIVGIAGPQWGKEPDPEAAVSGRDLVIVLDLSRSMLAEQPSRQERALRALRDLAGTLALHGGHRVALVVFAGRPHVVFPLTNDYDHFRALLPALDADNLPPELHPNPEEGVTSGTRIGAALRLAVALHDPRFQGAQDILLLSDGDDPAGDGEWAEGIETAKSLKIPIHAVGLGDPKRDSPIPFRDAFLQHGNEVVKTRLHEKPLQEIARRTGGIYLPARTSALPLGKVFRDVIEPRGERSTSEVESTADLPLPKQRYPWFLGAALALLTGTMLVGDRKRVRRLRVAGNGRWTALLILLLISAAPAGPTTDLVHEGNVAYDGEDYVGALDFYEQAEERTTDPGLVAFNKAAALYRLKKYREAELHYRRCLDDQNAPPLRRARGYYDLGNCLLKQALPTDAPLLERAMGYYRECLALDAPDAELTRDAQHNLELATLLWIKAKIAAKNSPNPPEQPDDPRKTAREQRYQDEPGMRKGHASDPGDQAAEKSAEGPDGQKSNKKQAAPGKLLNLPDQDELVPQAPEDVLATLDDAARRILGEHRDYRRQAFPVLENVKDW